MKTIPLTKGFEALVDDEDFERVAQHLWAFSNGYAVRDTKGRRVLMHRFILGDRLAGGLEVDHINGNKLDNRRSNIRPATSSQNKANRTYHHNRTGFRGVRAKGSRFYASMSRGPGARPVYETSRTFASAEEAARAYDAMARRRFGEFARLNFPPTTSKEK